MGKYKKEAVSSPMLTHKHDTAHLHTSVQYVGKSFDWVDILLGTQLTTGYSTIKHS
jgi:hypothetical protein